MYLQFNMRSQSLNKNTEVTMLLPEIIDPSHKPQCLYLLHGHTGNHNDWFSQSSIVRYVSKMNLAVIMPDAENSFYTNMRYGARYYDYIAKELPECIERTFAVSNRDEDRSIAGLSMGGYGALKIALREEGRYRCCAALSPISDIHTRIEKEHQRVAGEPGYTSRFIPVFGDPENVPQEDDVLYLAKKCRIRPRIFLGIGTEDGLYQNNLPFRDLMKELNYDFTYRESAGAHTWDFWDEYIQYVLAWMLEK